MLTLAALHSLRFHPLLGKRLPCAWGGAGKMGRKGSSWQDGPWRHAVPPVCWRFWGTRPLSVSSTLQRVFTNEAVCCLLMKCCLSLFPSSRAEVLTESRGVRAPLLLFIMYIRIKRLRRSLTRLRECCPATPRYRVMER